MDLFHFKYIYMYRYICKCSLYMGGHWNMQCQEPVSVLVSGLNSHLKTNSLCTAWNLAGVCGSLKEELHKWHFCLKNVECSPVQMCFKHHLQALRYNQMTKNLSPGRKADSQIICIREFWSLIKNWSKLRQGFQDFALHWNVHSKSIHSKITLHWEFTATRWLVRDDGFLKIPPILSSAK